MKQTIYTYHVDLDERGHFNAHVENSSGRTIAQYTLPYYSDFCVTCGETKFYCQCGEGFVQDDTPDWDILSPDWGIMKHSRDVQGLERHYKEVGIMPQSAILVLAD